ncbi:hypothetical protein ACFVR6_03585 [Microbacterium sp. NPDC058021]
MDEFDDVAQPRCPECGTVLRHAPKGFVCATCGLAFLPTMPSPGDPRAQ